MMKYAYGLHTVHIAILQKKKQCLSIIQQQIAFRMSQCSTFNLKTYLPLLTLPSPVLLQRQH